MQRSTKCGNCGGEAVFNYYLKPDGEYTVEYWRCADCLHITEVKTTLIGEVVEIKVSNNYL